MSKRIDRLLKNVTKSTAVVVSGLACLSAAAWVAFGVAAGLAAVGASLLFLDWTDES